MTRPHAAAAAAGDEQSGLAGAAIASPFAVAVARASAVPAGHSGLTVRAAAAAADEQTPAQTPPNLRPAPRHELH